VNASLRRDVTGFRFVLGAEQLESGILSPASYGALALLLAALYLSFRTRPSVPVLCGFSAGLLFLALIAPLQTAYGRPEFLHELRLDHEQYVELLHFSRDHLDFPLGPRLRAGPLAEAPALPARLLAAGSFMDLGWYMLLGGGLMLFLTTLIEIRSGLDRVLISAGLVALFVALTAAYLIGPLAAQWQLRRALVAQGEGRYEHAITHYRKAQRADSWHAVRPDIPLRIGELQSSLGASGGAELHLHKGWLLQGRGEKDTALSLYDRAAGDPALAPVARRMAARMEASRGLDLYALGSAGGAAGHWRQALERDPDRLDSLICLARSLYRQAEYEAALAGGRQALARVHDPFARAVLYSMMGDCNLRLRRDSEARRLYALSIQLNPERRNRLYDLLAGD